MPTFTLRPDARKSRPRQHLTRLTDPIRLLFFSALLLAAGSFLPAPSAMADSFNGEWQLISAPPPPPPPFPARTSFTMVLDTSRDRLVAFGGDPGPKNDVWVFPLPSGPAWTKLEPAGTPPSPRYGTSSAIYDPIGDRL